jgi:hypothetical protein
MLRQPLVCHEHERCSTVPMSGEHFQAVISLLAPMVDSFAAAPAVAAFDEIRRVPHSSPKSDDAVLNPADPPQNGQG